MIDSIEYVLSTVLLASGGDDILFIIGVVHVVFDDVVYKLRTVLFPCQLRRFTRRIGLPEIVI